MIIISDAECDKFDKFIQVGRRLHETGNYEICIDVLSTALKAHYGWGGDHALCSEQSEDDKEPVLRERRDESTTIANIDCEELQSSLSDQAFGFSSVYFETGNRMEDDRNVMEWPSQNAKGVMTALLIMTGAYFSLYQFRDSLAVCKQCLAVALDFKDKEFEIKSYVKLANIHHRLAQYTQAVSYNGKLLAVGRDLQKCGNTGEKHEEYWNSDLEGRAVWNLSAAYKLMGDYKEALQYAQEYIEVLKRKDLEELPTAYANLGELELLQGNYNKSLECHKRELQLCRKLKHQQGAAYAYGNIGTVYAHLGNFKLAAVNHEQHLRLSQSLNDNISELIALRNFGCMHKMMKNFTEAVSYFEQHLHLVKMNKLGEFLCKAYILIGSCYKEMHQLHHAQYYFETSLKLASEQNDLEDEFDCHLALAQIAASMRNFEKSRHYFNKVVPVLEEKLLSKYAKSLIYRDPLLEKLNRCYKELQEVLIEMNLPEEALEIAEHCSSRILVNILRQEKIFTSRINACASEVLIEPYSANDIEDILSKQNASVLFFSTVPSGFLLWMLSPGKGVLKCHRHRCCGHYSFADKIQLCMEEIHSNFQESYNCDHRALPRDVTNEPSKTPDIKKNQKSCFSCEFLHSSKLTPIQKLYHLLLSPIEDELKALLTSGTNELIIIPDLEVNSVPFPCLQDLNGHYFHEMFSVRILPCIRSLHQQINALSNDSSTCAEQDMGSAKILVQGNPVISSVDLNGKNWNPVSQSDLAEEEVNTIASLLGVDPVSGYSATKENFLTALPDACVVHLATYGSWSEACIALSPEAYCRSNNPPAESFLVTLSDIAALKLSAKVVVWNACCGCAHQYCQLKCANFHFVMALLAAGVQSVIMPLWSVPQASLLKLFFHFYSGLEEVSFFRMLFPP